MRISSHVNFIVRILLCKFHCANSVVQILSSKFRHTNLLCKFHRTNFIVQISLYKFHCPSIDIGLIRQTKKRSQVFCSTVGGALTGSHNLIKSRFNI